MRHVRRLHSLNQFAATAISFCLLTCVWLAGGGTAVAQAVRAGIPTAEKQAEIRKLVDENVELAKANTPAKKLEAAKKLMETANNDNLPPDELYVVLTSVLPLAKNIGDFTLFMEAADSLIKSFNVDATKEKERYVKEFLDDCKLVTALKGAVEEAIAQAQAAGAESRYADAGTLLNSAASATRRLSAASSLKQSIADAQKAMSTRETQWKEYEAALAKLKTEDGDPKANLTVGRWHVLQKGDWKSALPFLAKGTDAKWKEAAELELKDPQDATAQVSVGNAWWNIAIADTGEVKNVLLVHAGEWYDRALPGLMSLQKQNVSKRLIEIGPLKAALARAKPAAALAAPDKVATTKPGEWVDLLEWTEGVDWAPRGIDWNANLEGPPTRNGITQKSLMWNRFPLSAIIDGDYEMEVEFTRHVGNEAVGVFFPIGIHNMHLELGAAAGKVGGVHWIDGKSALDGNATTRRPNSISNNQRHRILIRVKLDGEKASFNIDWDDTKDYIKWEGPSSSLTNVDGGGWKVSMIQHVWLGNWANRTTFHKVRIRMTSGEVRRDMITDADRAQDLKNGFVRLVGEKANSPSVGWGPFLVNQYALLDRGAYLTERICPLISRDFAVCQDFYGAHAPSRLKCPIQKGAKSFSVVGYNDESRTTKYVIYADGMQLYDSGVTDIALIKVDLPPGTSFLELVIDPAGDNGQDASYWCYPRFHGVATDKITDAMLDGKQGVFKFAVASSAVGFGKLTHNEPIQDFKTVPVHFRDVQPCDEFLFAHAPSSVTYAVPVGMSRFTAIGYNVHTQHVKYEVWADAKRIHESPQAGIVPIDVKLPPGTKTIELKINDLGNNGDDQSMWCYPRLHRK